MPRGKKSGRAASGDGSIRKKIVKKNGKEYTYTYWNEKYTGRVLLQKTVSTGAVQIENNGLMEQYLYTGSYEATISEETDCHETDFLIQ